MGKPEGKRPRGRPRRRQEDGTGMDLKERRWEDVDWMHLTHDRDQPVAGSCEHGNKRLGFIKGR
jgi:hypothetical protein